MKNISLQMEKSGEVGVGTANPLGKFHVFSSEINGDGTAFEIDQYYASSTRYGIKLDVQAAPNTTSMSTTYR